MAALKKPAAKPKPAAPAKKPAAGPTMTPPRSGVKVRMYRQGLGDCFLLAFPTRQPGKAYYVLIDCGVILGTPNPAGRIVPVAESIEAATGGDIHLLIATHEHWDHLSGFLQAGDVFERLRVHNVWLAWTEDPTDALANQLRKEYAKDREALRLAVNRAVSPQALGPVRQLVEFFGETAPSAAGPARLAATGVKGAGRADTGAALEKLRVFQAKTIGGTLEYRHPGELVPSLPVVPGLGAPPKVHAYVLGPPHKEETLRRVNPTAQGQEVYTEGSGLTARTAFLMAALPASDDPADEDRTTRELSVPFEARLRIPLAEATQDQFFREHYGSGPSDENAWRRIDDDWLGAAGDLALKLDSFTNNTSLALAIELADTGSVLLFPADAQVGNWLSWGDLSWKLDEDKPSEKTVRIEDLLKRTVLYKVGHHASHNATMRARGLELMTSDDLVAMVPVNEQVAHDIKHWGKMPFEPLLKRLSQKTRGRVLRVDKEVPSQAPTDATPEEWKKFLAQIQSEEWFHEYVVEG